MVSFQSFSNDLSIGSIEEIYLKIGTNERRIQIYYPYSKNVNNKTKFIIMNDGESYFQRMILGMERHGILMKHSKI